MNERGQRIRVGLFVLASMITLGTLIVLFSKRSDLLTNRDRFVASFTNAPNLQPGTPVRRSGVKIGEVSRVELTADGTVIVEMDIDRRYPPRRNEFPAIAQSILTGDASIDLVTDPKEPNREPIAPDETYPNRGGRPLAGRGPLDTRQAVTNVQDLGRSAQETLDRIRESIEKFTAVAPQVDRTLKEYELLSQTVREAIPEIRQTNDSIRRLSDLARTNVPNFLETNERLKTALDNWNKAGERLNVLLLTNEKEFARIVENLSLTLASLRQLLNDDNQRLAQGVLQGAADLLGPENRKSVNNILKQANTLLSDENVHHVGGILKNLQSASENLDLFLRDAPATARRLNDTLQKADSTLENLRRITEPFADKSGDFQQNLNYATAQFGLLARDLRDLVRGFATSDGTVQKLLTDPNLYYQTTNAVSSFQRLLPQLELILEDLKDFSDKIARHPNQLIFDRQNPGLKGSPFAPTRMPSSAPTSTPPILIGPR
jgi:ABC-type transporter Mla subunit MlaD